LVKCGLVKEITDKNTGEICPLGLEYKNISEYYMKRWNNE
jgi:hypothetical protein